MEPITTVRSLIALLAPGEPSRSWLGPRLSRGSGPSPPTHDAQGLIDGEAARVLAATCATVGVEQPEHRFQNICQIGMSGPSTSLHISRAWSSASPERTWDADGTERRYEVEQLHLDLIEAARRFIYIENQFLTSSTIVTALCRRLQEHDGPEIPIVPPLKNSGWLEEHTIEVLRFRSMRQLCEADRLARLRVCYPVVAGLDGDVVQVHSKVIVIDDRLLGIGSSNLTNRSMRLDTECDLTIEATSAPEQRKIAVLHEANESQN